MRECVSRGHGRDARSLTLATGDVEMQKTIVLTRVATPLKTMPRRATRNFHSMSKTAAAPAKPSSRSASPSDCIKAQRPRGVVKLPKNREDPVGDVKIKIQIHLKCRCPHQGHPWGPPTLSRVGLRGGVGHRVGAEGVWRGIRNVGTPI